MTFLRRIAVAGVFLVHMCYAQACYQNCSSEFNLQIQQLMSITDTVSRTKKSCEAMSQQMVCLESKRPVCDSTSLQYVNTILNFIRPDYERTCAPALASDQAAGTGTTPQPSSTQQLLAQCSQKARDCYVTFNATYAPAVMKGSQDMVAICHSLDNYTVCLEDLMPECGQYMSRAISNIRTMQQQYSFVCSGSSSPETVTQCVNDTMDCYFDFNATFVPAVNQYLMADMCRAMDLYSTCLNAVHKRQDCQRYTQQALAGILTLKRQYSVYCGTDGGQQAQKCVGDFQACYAVFNTTYFPAMHSGNMDGICTSVERYSTCVEPLYTDCWRHMAQALQSVRVLKEQFALQCNEEFQKLSACKPLGMCLQRFASGFNPRMSSSTSTLCDNLSSYFPCVETSLEECKITPEDTSVDFSRLGNLTGLYCTNLLRNRVLNSCPEFVSCTASIVLVSSPDPSAMFDASTWCSYMDMSLSCVERAVNWPRCGLGNDDTINGHLKQQRKLKRDICKLASVPPISDQNGNVIPAEGNEVSQGSQAGQGSGSGSPASSTTWTFPLILVSLSLAVGHVVASTRDAV